MSALTCSSYISPVLSPTLGEAKQQVEKAARSPLGRGFARWGLLSRGALYVLVGVIAMDVSVGGGRRVRDRGGALATLTDTWRGRILVAALAFGLLGYAGWRFFEAIAGRTLERGERQSWWKRIGYSARGFWYLGLFGVAASALLSADESRGSRKEDRYTARLLDFPLGRWLVAAIGVAIIGAGVFNAWRALGARFRKNLKLRKMSELEDRAFTAVGVVGHLARGLVFGLIGFFLIRAAYQYDPKEAIGLDGALATVLQADYGDTLLGFVAAGLLAYGLYSFVEARYREV
jgi:hypothetical protein